MTDPLFGLPLTAIWFGVVFAFLGTFLFLDGFDFGAGALFATRTEDVERDHVLAAIGPFWDGNEVWLVVFGGALFAAFPRIYAGLFSRQYLLLFGVLGTLLLRGLAPEFYEQRDDAAWRRWWGRAFVAGSVGAPFLLGTFVGNWILGTEFAVESLVVGLAVVALTVVTGAAFLATKVDAPAPGMAADLRTWGLRAVAAYVALVVATLVALVRRPATREALLAPVSVALVAVSVLFVVGYAVALRRRKDLVAFGAAGGLTYGLVALVGVLLWPTIDPATGTTADEAVVGTLALNVLTVASAILLPLVLTYFYVLYSTFAGSVEEGGYGGH